MLASPCALRRTPAALRHVAKVAARVAFLSQAVSLGGDSILGEFGQILTAPPELDAAPETSTTPAPDGANDIPLATQIAALDEAYFLALNIEADEVERDHQRAEIARFEAEEADAWHCGMSCDHSAEIEAAQVRIAAIDERLFSFDLCADLRA